MKEWVTFPGMVFCIAMIIREWRLKRMAAEHRLAAVEEINRTLEERMDKKIAERHSEIEEQVREDYKRRHRSLADFGGDS